METRVAVISIIVEDPDSVLAVNELLHQYSEVIIGRMGIPYRAKTKKVNIIVVGKACCRDLMTQYENPVVRACSVQEEDSLSLDGDFICMF